MGSEDATRGKEAPRLMGVNPHGARGTGRECYAFRESPGRFPWQGSASDATLRPSCSLTFGVRAMSTTTSPAPPLAFDSFALAAGFQNAATACGLKPSGNLDLGLVWSDRACSAAGVFTTNRVQAAPVHVCRETLARAAARVRGVLYNSGCANAVTGERGLADAKRMRALGAQAIGAAEDEV